MAIELVFFNVITLNPLHGRVTRKGLIYEERVGNFILEK